MTETVYLAIEELVNDKIQMKVAPTHATLLELKIKLEGKCTITQIRKALRILHDSKRIKAGKTINDTFLQINEKTN